MIKLFSEEVNPTFTSSRHNILTVESYNEVFFDVFEFEINGTTYIAEKLSVYNGKPVVAIPVVEKDVKRTIPFVLTEGSFEVLYNEANNEVVNSAEDQRIIDSIMIEDDVVDIARDYKEDLLEEVEVAKRHAAEYAERVRLQKIAEADITIEEKKQSIREFFDTSKVDLLEEFNTALINNKQDFENYTEQKHSEIEKYLTSRIENNFSEFFDINEERIKELDGRIELSLVDKIKAAEGRVTKDVHETVSQQSDVLTEQIKKGVDKALGRVGNVKTAVNDLQDQLLEKIETVDGSIREYYDTRISNIRDEVDILNESQKDYFINLVEESKTRLLEQVNQNKEETVQALIEENYDPVKGNKDFNKSIKKLKVELEKVISDKFSGELMSLKRAIELSGGGGGTVAKQFANGGVMRGDLTVIGTVSADCGDSNDWCSTYTTVNANSALWNTGGYDFSLLESTSGNWNSTYTTVGTYSANWESTYTTVGSNSADWVTYSSDSISAANWVLDENNLGSNSNTKVPTQQSVKAYVDNIVTGVNNLKGGYDASTDSPPLTAGVGVLQGDTYYIETGGLFYTEQVDPGDLIIAIEDGSNAEGKWVAVNRNLQDELIDKWNSNYTTTSANSANWQSTYTTVDAAAGNWNSTYNTVTSLSDTWDDQFDSTEIEAASGNWNSTYTTVTNESADWESTYTTVDTESANWDSTYSTVGTYSADLGLMGGTELNHDNNNNGTQLALEVVERNTGAANHDNIVQGNRRGASAVDLQIYRTSADEVAAGPRSSLLGGDKNKIGTAGNGSTIIGGLNNEATSNYSAILAGRDNIITTQSCIAGGQSSIINHDRSFMFNAGDLSNTFSTVSADTFNVRVGNGMRLVFDEVDHTGDVLTCLDSNGIGKWASLYSSETISTTTHTQAVDTTHNLYNDDTAGAQIDVTLLAPTSHKGETTHMKIGSTADVVLTPTSGTTINGAGSYTLTTQYQAVKVFSDGTNYFAMA